MLTTDLPSCPFCGGIASWTQRTKMLQDDYFVTEYGIFCTACGIQTHLFVNSEDALNIWNNRHESSKLPKWMVEAIKTRIKSVDFAGDYYSKEWVHEKLEELNWVLSLTKS